MNREKQSEKSTPQSTVSEFQHVRILLRILVQSAFKISKGHSSDPQVAPGPRLSGPPLFHLAGELLQHLQRAAGAHDRRLERGADPWAWSSRLSSACARPVREDGGAHRAENARHA